MLLAKPVARLAAAELKKWRDSVLGAMAPATINRLGRCLCAAFEQAAQRDKRKTHGHPMIIISVNGNTGL